MQGKNGITVKRAGNNFKTKQIAFMGIFLFLFLNILYALPDNAAVRPVGANNNIIAYDPVENVFIYKDNDRNVNDNLISSIEKLPRKFFKKRGAYKDIFEYGFDETQAAYAAKLLNKNINIFELKKATLNISRLNEKLIRVELNNKLDGQWYRIQVQIPKGMMVKKIIRDDGIEIANGAKNKNGEVYDKSVCYMGGDTLYFYDDPIAGYSVVLSPPQPYFSLLLEIPTQGAVAGSNIPCGQQSALIYPYMGETDIIPTAGWFITKTTWAEARISAWEGM